MKTAKSNIALIIGYLALLVSLNIALAETSSPLKADFAAYAIDVVAADFNSSDDYGEDVGPLPDNNSQYQTDFLARLLPLTSYTPSPSYSPVLIRGPPVSSFAPV